MKLFKIVNSIYLFLLIPAISKSLLISKEMRLDTEKFLNIEHRLQIIESYKSNPSTASTSLKLSTSICYIFEKSPEKAEKLLATLPNDESNKSNSFHVIAKSYEDNSFYELAEKWYLKSWVDTGNEDSLVQLCKLRLTQGRVHEVSEYINLLTYLDSYGPHVYEVLLEYAYKSLNTDLNLSMIEYVIPQIGPKDIKESIKLQELLVINHLKYNNSVLSTHNKPYLKSLHKQIIPKINQGYHSKPCKTFTITSDHKYILSASDNIIYKWDIENPVSPTLKQSFFIPEHLPVPSQIFSLAVSPLSQNKDKPIIAASGYNKEDFIYLIDFETGNFIEQLYGHSTPVSHLEFSSDGNFLLSIGLDGVARVWNIASTKQKSQNQYKQQPSILRDGAKLIVSSKFITHDNQLCIISTNSHHSILLWRCNNEGNWIKEILFENAHKDTILELDISPDGKFIATSSLDNTVKVWNPTTGLLSTLHKLEYPDKKHYIGYSVAFTPDSNHLVCYSDSRLNKNYLIKLSDLSKPTEITGHGEFVEKTETLLHSDTGKTLTASLWHGDNSIVLYDFSNDKLLSKISNYYRPITSISLTEDFKDLEYGFGIDHKDYLSEKLLKKVYQPSNSINLRSFTPTNITKRSLDSKASHTFKKLSSNKIAIKLENREHETTTENHLDHIYTYALHPDLKHIIIGSELSLSLYRLEDNKHIHQFYHNPQRVLSLYVNKKDNILFSGSENSIIRMWDLSSNELLLNIHLSDLHGVTAWTSNGFYTSSNPKQPPIGWMVNLKNMYPPSFVPAANISENLYKPNYIQELLQHYIKDF